MAGAGRRRTQHRGRLPPHAHERVSMTMRALAIAALMMLAGAAASYADERYTIPVGATVKIDEHGQCRQVTNPAGQPGSRFVSTKTAAEWTSFRNNPNGLTMAECSEACETGPIGTPCSDGAIYIGNNPVSGIRIYVSASDDGAGITWNNGSSSWVDTPMTNCMTGTGAQDSCYSGYANTTLLYNLSASYQIPYRAARLCRDKGVDWYLPSVRELKVVFDNKSHLSGIQSGRYWSSSERTNGTSWFMFLSNGTPSSDNRFQPHLVRCVRQGST